MLGIIENGQHRYVREYWYEWLIVDVGQGRRSPRFYLPVRYHWVRRVSECWIFPLAPFVLALYLVRSAFKALWGDLCELLELYENRKKYEN